MTGRAVATCLADEPDRLLDALLEGRSGLRRLQYLPAAPLRTTMGYEIDDNRCPGDYSPAIGRVARVIRRALADAQLDGFDGRRVAVVLGTSQRGLRAVEQWASDGARAIGSDELSLRRAVVATVGAVRVLSVLGACAAGLLTVGLAADLLEGDEADVVLVVSSEPLHISVLAMHDRVSPSVARRIRPFDADREGTIFGEGAAAVVLERCGERDVTPKALVRGVGLSSDARRSTAPDVAGLVAAMADAHGRAGVTGPDVDLVLAHGTGTTRNDDAEADALTRLRCTRAFITSTKPMLGHTLGSAGLLNLVIAAECLNHGVVPPVLHLTTKATTARELICSPDAVVGQHLRIAQVDAFGFGGINAVAILASVR